MFLQFYYDNMCDFNNYYFGGVFSKVKLIYKSI